MMAGDASLLKQHNLIPCLNSAEQLASFERLAAGSRCALQLDTGMHRLGIQPAELAGARDSIARLRPELAISHLACADMPAHPQNASQLRDFNRLTATLPAMRRGLSATGGILLGEPFHFDLTRPGIGLYGGLPFSGAKPAVTLSLPVVQVRDVPPGGHVGYGAAWTAEQPARIATVAAGYADGLIRALGQSHDVRLYAGVQACPIVGRVSMDLITVDVTGLEQVPGRLEILNARQTIDDLATAAGTIGYEMLTGLGARYERVYKEAAPAPDPS
jgi:alanine racemase